VQKHLGVVDPKKRSKLLKPGVIDVSGVNQLGYDMEQRTSRDHWSKRAMGEVIDQC